MKHRIEGHTEEKQQGEEVEEEEGKGEVEVPCRDNQSAGGERSLSLYHSGMQEVTSESGQEQVQREEKQTQEERKRLTVKQQSRDRGAGVCVCMSNEM